MMCMRGEEDFELISLKMRIMVGSEEGMEVFEE